MDFSVSPSRSGPPTCAAAGIWLHSRYDPEKEARRFVESELASSRPSHVILLGPCLDYLSPVLRELLPRARIVSIQYSKLFAGASSELASMAWHPASGERLESFLDAALDEDAVSGVAVLDWEPASRAFPEVASSARKAVKDSLDRLASSTATVKSSGCDWIANACASFTLIERALTVRPTGFPILVAAAGPSLERSLRELSRLKGRFATIAVSSALSACRFAGIEPDIVVATDGGFWSRLHLYPLASRPLPIAAPLTALPSSSIYRDSGLLILDQGSFAESDLLPFLGASLALPAHGTVSGTALRLASRIGMGPILAAGLDLAAFGTADHARPHGFDAHFSSGISRLHPSEGGAWARVAESMPIALPEKPWRSSRSLSAYASALSLDSASLAGRLFRLSPSPVPLRGFESLDGEGVETLMGTEVSRSRALCVEESPIPGRDERLSILASRIAAWRRRAIEASDGMSAGRLPESGLVRELLRSVDIVDYAAARRAILSGGEPRKSARDLADRCESFLSDLERRFAS
jgi:hypothetical protein